MLLEDNIVQSVIEYYKSTKRSKTYPDLFLWSWKIGRELQINIVFERKHFEFLERGPHFSILLFHGLDCGLIRKNGF